MTGGNKVGVVTSGTAGLWEAEQWPRSCRVIALNFAEVRGKQLPMIIEKMPFVPSVIIVAKICSHATKMRASCGKCLGVTSGLCIPKKYETRAYTFW